MSYETRCSGSVRVKTNRGAVGRHTQLHFFSSFPLKRRFMLLCSLCPRCKHMEKIYLYRLSKVLVVFSSGGVMQLWQRSWILRVKQLFLMTVHSGNQRECLRAVSIMCKQTWWWEQSRQTAQALSQPNHSFAHWRRERDILMSIGHGGFKLEVTAPYIQAADWKQLHSSSSSLHVTVSLAETLSPKLPAMYNQGVSGRKAHACLRENGWVQST